MESVIRPDGNLEEMSVVGMIGDGSCLFRGLAYLVHGDQNLHVPMRSRIVRFIVEHWNEYGVRTMTRGGDPYPSAATYQEDMGTEGTMGSAAEVQAAGDLYPALKFEIYSDRACLASFGTGSDVKCLRFSGPSGSGHYDVYESVSRVITPIPPTQPKSGRPAKRKRGRKAQDTQGETEDEKKLKRMEKMRENSKKRREKEDEEQKKERLETLKETVKKRLSKESEEEKKKRLEDKRENNKRRLEKESEEEKRKRLEEMTENSKRRLEKENEEEKRKRLEEVRENSKRRLEKENEEEKRKRLEEVKENSKRRLEKENEEEKRKRLEDMKNRVAQRILSETTERRSARLRDLTERRQERIETEDESSRQDRLESTRRRVSTVRLVGWKTKLNSAFCYDPNVCYDKDPFISIGSMNVVCPHCKALKWRDEAPGLCCSGGNVLIDSSDVPPEPLFSLLTDAHTHSKHFLENTRRYNTAFQMTSFGANFVKHGNFMPTFKIQGQVYHRLGSLLPTDGAEAKFLQIYFTGEKETDLRCKNNPTLNSTVVKSLQTMLHDNNSYIQSFKTTLENNPPENLSVVIHADKVPVNAHRGRFNAPTCDEVAVMIVGEEYDRRDIIIKAKDDKLMKIYETHRSYDALQYPLLFPRGEDGYHFLLKQTDGKSKLSSMNFYSYKLMVRENNFNNLHYFRRLFSQFIVDMYVKIESERLLFYRTNQSSLRAENYFNLRDAISVDGHGHNVGQPVILPATFTGGPRFMNEKTQDAMCYVRLYGRPDLFITKTCNPKWEEIERELFKDQKSHDRHDIIARVFSLKVKALMKLLTKGQVFGPVRCFMYTVEWQKRGLPHVHILIWLQNKINPNAVDSIISAELPDPKTDPELYEIIKSQMIHGPCGALNPTCVCMKDGQCTKKYPKPFVSETQMSSEGYPTYKRRSVVDGGVSFEMSKSKKTIIVDNRWVVPYSPLLCRTFKAHINVEFCNSVKSIKYVCKYINKGSDQATFTVQNEKDEVSMYQSGRYVSSSEGAWRIFRLSIHARDPPVQKLAVHLKNGQRVIFDPSTIELGEPPATTLTAFFDLCQKDDFARTLLYYEVPAFYTWNNNKTFSPRKQGEVVEGFPHVRKKNVVGRIYTVHMNHRECFFLRLLLHHVRGPVSFEALRTVNDKVYQDYQSACKVLGLLEDDDHWEQTLAEAALTKSPSKLRHLFVIMLAFGEVSDPLDLWLTFRDDLSEDYLYQARISNATVNFCDEIYNRSLLDIDRTLLRSCGKTVGSFGLPVPRDQGAEDFANRYWVERCYDPVQLLSEVNCNEPLLNLEQKLAYHTILHSVDNGLGDLYFLDAPGGTGKTFLISLILSNIRSKGQIALGVASSGVAATLLPGGRTAHSAFKLPLNLNYNDQPMCNIKRGSVEGRLLQECVFIVWDECTMSNKSAFEALDRTLQDLRGNSRLMGGMTVLLSGDFRQTLPVVPRGTRADEIKACVKKSYLWPNVKTLKLTTNMRVCKSGNPEEIEFSKLLLDLGNGDIPDNSGEIVLPKDLGNQLGSLEDLITAVYPCVNQINIKTLDWFCERAILASTNEAVDKINEEISNLFVAEEKTYFSVDRPVEDLDVLNYPVEFLNSLTPSGMPPYKLLLKVGSPIMCLRNLKPPSLCNGTRLQVTKLMDRVIEARIITGTNRGEYVFIPRIPMVPSDYPIPFRRTQFPVKVCFAMTINKSQGQSIKVTGMDLTYPCFSHGQLYVGCSRVSSPRHLYLLTPNGRTPNVVYKEVI